MRKLRPRVRALKLAAEVRNRISDALGQPVKVIMFGSQARGDATKDSDIDLLVLVDDDDWRFSHAISRIAARISLDYDVLLCPRVIRHARWRRSLLFPTVSAEGIPLVRA